MGRPRGLLETKAERCRDPADGRQSQFALAAEEPDYLGMRYAGRLRERVDGMALGQVRLDGGAERLFEIGFAGACSGAFGHAAIMASGSRRVKLTQRTT